MEHALLVIGLMIFLGHFLSALFARTKVPDVLLLIGAGFLIGPNVLNWTKPSDFGVVGGIFSRMALIIMLFEAALTVRFATLRRVIGPTLLLTALTALSTFGVSVVGGSLVLHDWYHCMILGAVLCCTAASVVIPLIQSLRLQRDTAAILTLESALSDIICVVLVVALTKAKDFSHLSMVGLPFKIALEAGISSVVGLVGALAWLIITKWVSRVPNTLLAEIAFVFVLSGVAEIVGGSGPITALVFGLSVANLPTDLCTRFYNHEALSMARLGIEKLDAFAELAFLMKVGFFAYLGLSLQLTASSSFLAAGVICLGLYPLRMILTVLCLPKTTHKRDAYYAALMVPKGLVSAVLASNVAVSLGTAEGDTIRDITYAVILMSIVTTSVCVPMATMPGMKRVCFWALWKFPAGDATEGTTGSATTEAAPSQVAAAGVHGDN